MHINSKVKAPNPIAPPVAPPPPAAGKAPVAPPPAAAKARAAAASIATPAIKPPATGPISAPKLPIQGRDFSSTGDPHEVSGDGLKFDNQKTGVFTKLRSASGDFEIQTKHEACENLPGLEQYVGAVVNTEIAVRTSPSTLVRYNSKSDALTVNGQSLSLAAGESKSFPDGTQVAKDQDGRITITTPKKDSVTISDYGAAGLDFSGSVSASRASGEVKGSLGSFDFDTATTNDLLMRNGKLAKSVDEFLESWRAVGPAALLL